MMASLRVLGDPREQRHCCPGGADERPVLRLATRMPAPNTAAANAASQYSSRCMVRPNNPTSTMIFIIVMPLV